MTNKQNHLQEESSLYLQQHTDNPVDWYPWGEIALTKAKQANKPILLSIGYSACHWCHVMANESFVDEETAKIMNEHFVNIKVDREERPDLDKVYQLAQQLLTGRGGGWPLTMFLSPRDQTPFFGGTYFPLQPRHGMPSFKEVLLKVVAYFHAHQPEIHEQSTRVKDALLQLSTYTLSNEALTPSPLNKAQQELEQSFDNVNGGFGNAPKFPNVPCLEYLFRLWTRVNNQPPDNHTTLTIVQTTLTKMAYGGIYDQIGGGFYRYAVDAAWQIPHFEKMLYDNAQLLAIYAQASSMLNDALFKRITAETAEWSLREMHSPNGGFYATLDADSEHEEGKFYYWDYDEVKNLLSAEEFNICTEYFNLSEATNFEGHWHLHIKSSLRGACDEAIQNSVRHKLLAARNKRSKPGRDEKILTAWNGLMIKGMALAGQALNREEFIATAQQTLDFIQQHLWKNNSLFSCYQNGEAKLPAHLDDYAFLLDGILTLLQVRWRTQDLQFAMMLADILLTHFADLHSGGFFFTADHHEPLIQRPKTLADDAVPAGNGIAACALARLGNLLGEPLYLEAAEKTLKLAWYNLLDNPSSHASLLIALEEYVYPPQLIILRGNETMLKTWQISYSPQRLLFRIPAAENNLPENLAAKIAKPNQVVAYVCEGQRCLPPIEQADELQKILIRN